MPVTVSLRIAPTARERRPVTAQQIHAVASSLFDTPPTHRAKDKPFAVWPLMVDDAPDTAAHLHLRVTDLRDRVPDIGAWRARPIRLGSLHGRVTHVGVDWQPFQDLACAPPHAMWDITFLSPTYFRRGDRDYLLPDPALIVTGLAARWNTWVDPGSAWVVPAAAVTSLRQSVIVTDHDVATAMHRMRHPDDTRPGVPAEQPGFVGAARITVATGDSGDIALLSALMRFAAMAGVGAQTTWGMGAVEVEPATATDRGRPGAVAR